ncbi:MAG: pyridoxal-phosphate dependent enzyme, partial [Pseudomonadota bacterium]
MTAPVDTHLSVQEYRIGDTAARRIALARTPTALQFLPRLSEEVGANIWIKRDDTTDTVACGNKLRKLEFSVAQALSEDATVLLTNGGVQSNHCRATALVAANLGLQAHLVLRGDPPDSAPDGNLLLDELLGAETTFIDTETWRRIDEFTAELVADYERTGVTAFAIPTGASDEIGLWGYIRGFEELHNDLLSVGMTPDAIIHATGSGGTQAGLILGAALMGLSTRIVGINVSDNEDYFTRKITDDLYRWHARYQAN